MATYGISEVKYSTKLLECQKSSGKQRHVFDWNMSWNNLTLKNIWSELLGSSNASFPLQGSASSLLASLEREKELLRIFLKVSQMENTILRRMNLSSFLMVSRYTSRPASQAHCAKVNLSQPIFGRKGLVMIVCNKPDIWSNLSTFCH